MIDVSGKTKLYGIVADPIGQVKAPEMMRKVFEQRGIDGVLMPMHVAPKDLPVFTQALRGIQNFGGMVVTVPHKTTIGALLDAPSLSLSFPLSPAACGSIRFSKNFL